MLKPEKLNRNKTPEDLAPAEYAKPHEYDIRCMATTEDSETLFSADKEGNLLQWDIIDLTLVADYGDISEGMIYSIALTADGMWLFSSDDLGYVRQYSVQEKEMACMLGKLHHGEIYSICCSYDVYSKSDGGGLYSKYLFTSDSKGKLIQYNIDEGEIELDYGQVSSGEIMSICCTRDNNYLFVADDKGVVKQFSMEYQSVLREFVSPTAKRIYSVCTSFNNSFMITSNVDGEINQFQVRSQEMLKPYSEFHSGEVGTLCVSKDNRCVLSGDSEGGLLEWDWKYESYGFNGTDKYGRGSSSDFDFGEITAIEISPRNQKCWVGNNRGYVFFLTREGVGWTLTKSWKPHNSEVVKIVYMQSPMKTFCDEDPEEILTCGEKEVKHWNIYDMDKALGSWSKCKDNMKDLVLGPDLKAFAFSDDKGCVCICHIDREAKEPKLDLMDPGRTTMKEAWINSMVITPDG